LGSRLFYRASSWRLGFRPFSRICSLFLAILRQFDRFRTNNLELSTASLSIDTKKLNRNVFYLICKLIENDLQIK
jgi:hypothetical protein